MPLEPVTRELIASFVLAVDDKNRMHVDEEFAHAAGHPTVMASGQMTIGWIGQYLRSFSDFRRVVMFSVQLRAPVYVDDVIELSGEVVEVDADGTARCELVATKVPSLLVVAKAMARVGTTDERKQPESDSDK
jgi:acyl dehydratase